LFAKLERLTGRLSMSSDERGPPKPQRPHRLALSAEVGLRRSGAKAFRVRVFDLSPEGCKVEFVERPSIGERVWLKFDSLESLEGSVRWVAGHVGGLKFEQPLHEAVFRRLTSAKGT
jgi:PilZ domain